MVVKNFLQIIQMTMILAMQVKTLCVVMPVYIYTFIIDRYSDCYDEYKPQSYYPPNYEITLLQGMYFLYKIMSVFWVRTILHTSWLVQCL